MKNYISYYQKHSIMQEEERIFLLLLIDIQIIHLDVYTQVRF